MSAIEAITQAWTFLWEISPATLLAMLWLTLIIEIPRYFLGLQATAAALLLRDKYRSAPLQSSPCRVSLLLVGHNEEGAIEKCVRSLRCQTFNHFEIVCVDDGSSDNTYPIMCRLQREGLVECAARLDLRGGKAAGINFAARLAKGDIFLVVDCDCSFEPDAIEELIRPLLADPDVAAVSGNILVRNWRQSVTASLQAIEYLVSISLGKAYANHIDQVSCVSGAFGAFRRHAWERVFGMDTGGGEDLDFTIRLRLAGYKIVFARHSVCYTDVPDTLYALLRQRNRWERDAFWIRFRKFQRIMNPYRREFSWRDAVHQWDFVLVNMLPTLAFPFYLAWLVTRYDDVWPIILIAVSLALYVLDIVTFVCAVLVSGKPVYWRLFPFLLLYGPFQSYVMRLDRFYAYVTEWIYSLSLRDNYVPQKVRDLSGWR
jgi:cellulose synthase/poly-beta-1,6-N-acetylglucosamine synthase-like glycosyltransferase